MALCVKVIPSLEQLKYPQIMYSYYHSPLAFYSAMVIVYEVG